MNHLLFSLPLALSLFGDYPQRNADYTGTDRFTEWMLLSYGKPVSVSSTDSTLIASNLSDEDIRTYWSAATGNAGEWMMMDLGAGREVRALQLNFYDRHTHQTNRANDTYYQYRVWASDDAQHWTLAVDKSDADRDTPHDYVELIRPLRTRYLKVENIHMPGRSNFCLSDLRVFGHAEGARPELPKGFSVDRKKSDPRNALLSWQPAKGAYGYNIYYGTAKDKLYHCITVNGATSYDLRGLDLGTDYYFAIQSLAETGMSPVSKTIKK